jgi:LPXTG-motif cell wall-anchored protein
MTRRIAAFPLAMAAALLLVSTAVAGGWATATLDPGTNGPRAGTPTTIGFVVLQHGVTPNSSLAVVVHAASAGGGSISANAIAQGAKGHYVATLTFPTEGAWTITWTSELDMAESSALLTVVAAAAAPVSAPAPVPASAGADTAALLLVGVILALAVAGGVVGLRRRRSRASAPSLG